jgi:anti-anti-sigma factor
MTEAFETSRPTGAGESATRSHDRSTEGEWITGRPTSDRDRQSQVFFARRVSEGDAAAARVYALGGVFRDSKGAYAFLDELRHDVAAGAGAVVVDLRSVDQMTSCGVGILAAAYTATQNAGCPMALVGMRQRLVAVMRAVGLLSVIPNYETREQALTAIRFRRPRSDHRSSGSGAARITPIDGESP